MKAIDFMNKSIYSKQPGVVNDRKSHPKFVLICPNGIILYSDLSNDGKQISFNGRKVNCSHHEHYISKLIENYFPDKINLIQKLEQGNTFAPIFKFLEEGNVIFNNITTYEGLVFFLNGVRGQLLIPENLTDAQKEALSQLDPYVNYFNEIELKEYQDVSKDIKDTYIEKGSVVIQNYLDRQHAHRKPRH